MAGIIRSIKGLGQVWRHFFLSYIKLTSDSHKGWLQDIFIPETKNSLTLIYYSKQYIVCQKQKAPQ